MQLAPSGASGVARGFTADMACLRPRAAGLQPVGRERVHSGHVDARGLLLTDFVHKKRENVQGLLSSDHFLHKKSFFVQEMACGT